MTQICPHDEGRTRHTPPPASDSSPHEKDALVIEKQSYFILPLQAKTIDVSLFYKKTTYENYFIHPPLHADAYGVCLQCG